jgi:predicted transposase/invertase (TIGR01784 family)
MEADKNLQKYVEKSDNDLVKAIHRKVTEIKESKEMQAAYMKTMLWEQEIREEGRAQGMQDAIIETARKLKSIGISLEQIAQVTDLSFAEIKNL